MLLTINVSYSTQSLPSDLQKIRTALAGILYAYEIPLPTITCENECSSSVTPSTEEEKVACNSSSAESQEQCCDVTANQDTNCETAPAICNNESNSDNAERKGSKSSGTNSENSSEDSETRLRVQEDWFAEGKKNKKKGSSSPIRKLSPKIRRRISPKFGIGGFSLTGTLRKSSSSSSSIELTEAHYISNSDSGISLSVENSPNRKTLSVPGNADANSRNSSLSSTPTAGPSPYLGCCFSGFVVAMHRKTVSHFVCFYCIKYEELFLQSPIS